MKCYDEPSNSHNTKRSHPNFLYCEPLKKYRVRYSEHDLSDVKIDQLYRYHFMHKNDTGWKQEKRVSVQSIDELHNVVDLLNIGNQYEVMMQPVQKEKPGFLKTFIPFI